MSAYSSFLSSNSDHGISADEILNFPEFDFLQKYDQIPQNPAFFESNNHEENEIENNEITSSEITPRCMIKGVKKIAFKTKSDVDVLDDGFKWRKYGKKMVKNSPNPRNYYKCSSEGCQVKKRIERAGDDLRFIITTYEGIHNHHPPLPPPSSRQVENRNYTLNSFYN